MTDNPHLNLRCHNHWTSAHVFRIQTICLLWGRVVAFHKSPSFFKGFKRLNAVWFHSVDIYQQVVLFLPDQIYFPGNVQGSIKQSLCTSSLQQRGFMALSYPGSRTVLHWIIASAPFSVFFHTAWNNHSRNAVPTTGLWGFGATSIWL